MRQPVTRREVLRGGLAAAALASMGIPEWALPALAQGEELVPFTDFPANFNPNPSPIVRFVDTRTIDSFYTPADKWFTIQHYGQPDVDLGAYKLKITGMLSSPREYTLDELMRKPKVELPVGFECSGNSKARMHGLVSNGRWTGVRLSTLLKEAGMQAGAREVVFYGADKGTEEISHGSPAQKVEQHFARSLATEDASKPEVFLAYHLNGAPLTKNQGSPLRLITPGWYGVANVKWLQRIHLQDRRFMGRFMARDYVTLRARDINGETEWTESSVGRIQLKSIVVRVTRMAVAMKVTGFALTDTTPLKAVEVKVDNGPWQAAEIDKQSTDTSWKLFTYRWQGASPGGHSIVSRAIDINGNVQPAEEDSTKKTRWENNAQLVRTVMVS
ncbi:MAG: molybdopterin-dependent oxidoreductase [Candidatus Korobacteraceae bacterium]